MRAFFLFLEEDTFCSSSNLRSVEADIPSSLAAEETVKKLFDLEAFLAGTGITIHFR